ncbi:MAG: RES family NAD+ phosphorylase [Thermoanaerobaculia bacterium]
MSSDLPVPDPAALDPQTQIWPQDRQIVRCHDSRFGATEFNPGIGSGRFHPFADRAGRGVPTLYGAGTLDGAFSETLFHGVSVRGPGRIIRRGSLKPMLVSTLAPDRDLTLVQLHGYGLRRLGISRAELIETDSDRYGETVLWARALHAWDESIDGLVWVSRQHDTSAALVLFGDRVRREQLRVIEPPLPLYVDPGFDMVERAAQAAGISVVAVPE